jgi:hypothetical protein
MLRLQKQRQHFMMGFGEFDVLAFEFSAKKVLIDDF